MTDRSDNTCLKRLYQCLDVVLELKDFRSLPMMQLLIIVATRGPIGLADIGRAMSIPSPMVTMYLQRLGGGAQNNPADRGEPLHLVTLIDDPHDGRRKLAMLTPLGSTLVVKLRAAMGNP